MDLESCYKIFGISAGASDIEVKQAYRNFVKIWHPDLFSNNSHLKHKAEEKLKKANRSYELLIKQKRCIKKQVKDKYSPEKRNYYRKTCFIPVDFHIKNDVFRSFWDSIQNLSASGLFISTKEVFLVGQKIALTFSLPLFGDLINIPGYIVRTTPLGIGAKFIISDQHQRFLSVFV